MYRYLGILTLLVPAAIAGITGYNCEGEGLNITTLSLLDVGECAIDDIEPTKTEVYVQLMQISDYDSATIFQCQLQINREIFYCGMHSHISMVGGGKIEYIKELGKDTCRRIHETGSITIVGTTIDGLERNATNRRAAILAGRASADGTCKGSSYTDNYGSWDNVVVQATLKITLRNFEAPIKRATRRIILPSGTHCDASRDHCVDTDGMETYWTATSTDSCHFDQYDILYEGIAIKLSTNNSQGTPDIYTVSTRDTTFALTKTQEINLCGYLLFRTEHPKLLIMETQRGRTFKPRTRIAVDNLDIFTYVNSKFVYVEKHIKNQLTRLYRDVMEQKCALERQILQNALSLASIAPDEMAYRIAKAPGHTAVVVGEVIHLVKCIPMECKLRHTETCFNELPVTCKNASYFLLPRSHILTRKGTPRDCNELLTAMYKVHATWYKITQRPTEIAEPPTIRPLTHPTWKYVDTDSLAASGIYTEEDLSRLRDHIMFPVERPSTLNTIARGAMGQTIPSGSISITNLFDEESLDRIAESTGRRLWKGFVTFGSASAGIMAIFIIARFIKLIVDTIIHGYALHTVYGWSIHLLGALWSSVANLLLHLGRPQQMEQQRTNPEYRQLKNELPKEGPTAPEDTPPAFTTHHPDNKRQTQGNIDTRSYGELRQYLDENRT